VKCDLMGNSRSDKDSTERSDEPRVTYPEMRLFGRAARSLF
jgi:hypothetical protein